MADSIPTAATHTPEAIMLDVSGLPENTQVVTISQEDLSVGDVGRLELVGGEVGLSGVSVSEDILQRALEEVSQSIQNAQNTIPGEYVQAEQAPPTTGGTGSVAVPATTLSSIQVEGTELTAQNLSHYVQIQTPGVQTAKLSNGKIMVVQENEGVECQNLVDDNVIQADMAEAGTSGVDQAAAFNQNVQIIQQQQLQTQPAAAAVPREPQAAVAQEPPQPVRIIMTTDTGHEPAPLGSSQNPIRIIQQGNQYTSLQQLSGDQLAQIMQVVQQQQAARAAQEGATNSSILFNPQTQTRIVYKVLHPSELHKSKQDSEKSILKGGISVMKPGGPRRYQKRKRNDDIDKMDGPDLSREEKKEKKKHRPRTRYGRVSRPPKHMVKDYKHIHVLDWDEDFDDSDGGYSDYTISDGESKDTDGVFHSTRLYSGRPKNHRCSKCDKSYIGKGGLARHYRLNPDHGSPEDLGFPSTVNGDYTDESNQSMISDKGVTPEGSTETRPTAFNQGHQAFTVSSTTQAQATMSTNKSSSIAVSPALAAVVAGHNLNNNSTPTKPAGLGAKVRENYAAKNTPSKRLARLKEMVRQCQDEELMEVVLPRLAQVITLWEFLLMKVEQGHPARPSFPDVYREYEQLHGHVSKMCLDYLSSSEVAKHGPKDLKVSNVRVAQSLGMLIQTQLPKEQLAANTQRTELQTETQSPPCKKARTDSVPVKAEKTERQNSHFATGVNGSSVYKSPVSFSSNSVNKSSESLSSNSVLPSDLISVTLKSQPQESTKVNENSDRSLDTDNSLLDTTLGETFTFLIKATDAEKGRDGQTRQQVCNQVESQTADQNQNKNQLLEKSIIQPVSWTEKTVNKTPVLQPVQDNSVPIQPSPKSDSTTQESQNDDNEQQSDFNISVTLGHIGTKGEQDTVPGQLSKAHIQTENQLQQEQHLKRTPEQQQGLTPSQDSLLQNSPAVESHEPSVPCYDTEPARDSVVTTYQNTVTHHQTSDLQSLCEASLHAQPAVIQPASFTSQQPVETEKSGSLTKVPDNKLPQNTEDSVASSLIDSPQLQSAEQPTELLSAEQLRLGEQPMQLQSAVQLQSAEQPTHLQSAEQLQDTMQPTQLHSAEQVQQAEQLTQIQSAEQFQPAEQLQPAEQPTQEKDSDTEDRNYQIQIFQNEDGLVFIQNRDGSTYQLRGPNNEPLSLEAVQGLLAMEGGLPSQLLG